jgi:hypothetical protein
MIKTTGAQFKRFYGDKSFWPDPPSGPDGKRDALWHEDETITVDGVECNLDYELSAVPENSIVTISGGAMYGGSWEHGEGPSFEAYFRKWKKQDSMVSIVLTVPKEHEATVRKALDDLKHAGMLK